MAAHQDQASSRLLTLPRELRDIIYDNLLEPSRTFLKPSKTSLRATLQNAPLSHVRLINRQINDEYDSRTRLWTKLLLADHKSFDFSTIKLPRLPDHNSIAIHIFVTCDECDDLRLDPCAAPHQICRHYRWLAEVLQTLPRDCPAHLKISMWSDGQSNLQWPALGHCDDATLQIMDLSGLPQIASIAVYSSGRYCYDPVEGFREDRICARWLKTDG
ncbi:hypothetical protein DOTSEDRAFT_79804 [Dothistroma septosporum NZE10]|uniref:Uncharacterized protein n=1 Tax=Dothistroma septosporum (strain NZE10 / CBS 128990) TaxID=675120 RepID=N1PN52_DOTSN|nr:hypothetical protein DOTSEDRAFT_79804 [Dothistroma septosporum NZE10]